MNDPFGSVSSMPAPFGVEQPTRHHRKLTPDAVLDIWSRKDSQADYEERYSVTRGAIQSIQAGRTWGWLTKSAPAPAKRLPSGPRKRLDGAA